ncbi:MAG: ABC transporter permease [Gaiellales bacterium]
MKTLADASVLALRALREIPRLPTRIVFPLLIPIMQLVLFTAVFTQVTRIPGFPASSSLDFLAAGNVALSVLVGAGGAGFQMVQDIDSGFFDKLRVSPVSRAAIVLGLLLTDAVRLALHALVVLTVAVLMGAKLATGVPGVLVIMLLGGLFGAAWSGVSLNVALRTRSPEVTGASGVLVFPLYFASTSFMPRSLLPSWLQTANDYNPVSYLIDAMRAIMLDGWRWGTIGAGFLAALAVGMVTLPLAVAAFRQIVKG